MPATQQPARAACPLCGTYGHVAQDDAACEAVRAAREAGERPTGVPVRVQAAYVEARRAMRSEAPEVAIRSLQWLLAHLAETRGVDPGLSLVAKTAALVDQGVVAKTVRPRLIEQALSSSAAGPEAAWALMTLVEHALARAYLRAGR